MVLRIFLRVIAQTLQASSPGAARTDKAALHIGAVAFIYCFGSSFNEHVHFHVCEVDGVFEEAAGEGGADADADAQALAQAREPGVIFHPATGIACEAVHLASRGPVQGFCVRGRQSGGRFRGADHRRPRHLGRLALVHDPANISALPYLRWRVRGASRRHRQAGLSPGATSVELAPARQHLSVRSQLRFRSVCPLERQIQLTTLHIGDLYEPP